MLNFKLSLIDNEVLQGSKTKCINSDQIKII